MKLCLIGDETIFVLCYLKGNNKLYSKRWLRKSSCPVTYGGRFKLVRAIAGFKKKNETESD